MISIIIPTYNAAHTLERCLSSIVNQTFSDMEVWLIDGISTDHTLDIVKRFQSRYAGIHLISEQDKGIYDAMNKGIAYCKGDWLYFLGADDELYGSDVLEEVNRIMLSGGSRVIYGNVMMRGHNQWNLNEVVFDGKYDLDKIVNTNICHQAIFYHKSIFSEFGLYNLNYITGADHDFNLRCYARVPFTYADIIVANFHVGGHSTHVQDDEFHKERGAMLLKYFRRRLFSGAFVNSRLYIQRAALSAGSPLGLKDRLICLAAYINLKVRSLLT
ncbi:glycosyltransferase family 2 protein [Mucilaginibacter sabulilitoris]|uniref:Glycosyltransferase family 2 protein n=1 Tax=Mucilaginibacter sabulilitoris TaxID=1173583 RepID=A0ABZ0TJ91_9SPHI|nr:glycosyltransferase family 2 protein [Mucilaginibacter sabulilitoris]WPU91640.1 glycosyltransferase family 2 protein [Mucilaginibacter sabulilitoris]